MTLLEPPDVTNEFRSTLTTNQSKDSQLAIASLITGILGWTILPVLGSVAAIITGHLANKEIKESNGALSGKGMATAGLILGYIQLAFVVLIMIIAILGFALSSFWN
jgi:hypothetical protein